ncbi:MAG: hypothetical protein DRR42_28310 [Gammaproteobacteria bacterium]|nr:MAG: hypothetical protein DRR42_28310 [Gammaproteobacteria bacterium]
MPIPQITLGIVSCCRPTAAERLLKSIIQHEPTLFQQIHLVNNSGITERKLNQEYRKLINVLSSNYLQIDYDEIHSCGPSEARSYIADKFKSDYLLLLDDDLFIDGNSNLNAAVTALAEKNFAVLGGVWLEEKHSRAFGSNLKIINKSIFRYDIPPVTFAEVPFPVDIPQMSCFIRADVIRECIWDKQFEFFFECMDFFMQLKKKGLISYCMPNLMFKHDPISYLSDLPNIRRAMKEEDKQRFMEKWDLERMVRNGVVIYPS